MNSISGSLTSKSIVATAKMLRSAKKEVFLIVEGDNDIALFSHSLKLPRSNFISCFGKERLMEVFELVPIDGLDSGTILLRDTDCDGVGISERDGVILLTSDLYDFEMSLLPRRVFSRIFGEFLKTRSTPELSEDAFKRIVEAASLIGALRHVSHAEGLNIDFKEYKTGFLDAKALSVDIDDMLRYFLARSEKEADMPTLKECVIRKRTDVRQATDVTSGKDFLRILSVALARFYKCCNAAECSFETLSRMFRIAVTHDDLKELALYPVLAGHVARSPFEWKGASL